MLAQDDNFCLNQDSIRALIHADRSYSLRAGSTASLADPLQSPAMATSALRAHRSQRSTKIEISLANADDRPEIYRIRHQIYALELRQHDPNTAQALTDLLDEYNIYLKASVGGCLVGFVSVTPPGYRYSVDKYFERDVFPFPFDAGVYEVRLLTVLPEYRRLTIASLLMYGALRWIEAQGGRRIVAIGRHEVLTLYLKAGLKTLGRSTQSGAVTYELLSATVTDLRDTANRQPRLVRRLKLHSAWRLPIPFHAVESCRHGGDSFHVIGEDFDDLGRGAEVINADVLDAWFPPSPRVLSTLEEHLPFLVRTSPPTDCAGLVRAIARARGIPEESIVPAAGSSELIFLAFREWLNPDSRVLLLDPSYAEYAHVTERVVGCDTDRLELRREDHYRLNAAALEAWIAGGHYDLIVIVNPNSPTGQHLRRSALEPVLRNVPPSTRVWIDETYIDYAGADQSQEAFAALSRNVVVCKSMSKVYGLSGVRAAYMCAPAEIALHLRKISPPWAVSLPAQVAAVRVLEDPEYYAARYRETQELRESLADELRSLGFDVVPSVANFLLCHLAEESPDAATISRRCREHGLYVRDAGEISALLGTRALRIAVKDEETNRRMVRVLADVLAVQA
jgi:histidinol-phosphate/aromatic aminotransferase/cobyric acid decarboxylase-like protein/GNAT superfamily N-acetyltransferase